MAYGVTVVDRSKLTSSSEMATDSIKLAVQKHDSVTLKFRIEQTGVVDIFLFVFRG